MVKTEQAFCQSYFDEADMLTNCTCGKCQYQCYVCGEYYLPSDVRAYAHARGRC